MTLITNSSSIYMNICITVRSLNYKKNVKKNFRVYNPIFANFETPKAKIFVIVRHQKYLKSIELNLTFLKSTSFPFSVLDFYFNILNTTYCKSKVKYFNIL